MQPLITKSGVLVRGFPCSMDLSWRTASRCEGPMGRAAAEKADFSLYFSGCDPA